jgi:hyperosmotically inducible protein
MKYKKYMMFILIFNSLLSIFSLANADEVHHTTVDNQHNQSKNGGSLLSDINITASIKRKLFEESDVNSARVHVVTEHGKVTLTGTVTDEQIEEKVISIAKNTNGVKEVVYKIEIGSKNITSDACITTLIKLRLLEDERLSSLDIHVITVNGKVTLTGVVPDKESNKRAIEIAKMTNGVKSVDSQLEINKDNENFSKKIISDSIITASLKLSLLEDEHLSGLDIHIKTVNGKVTLTGVVPDKESNKRAIEIAKLTNGVKQVESKLSIKK